MNKSTSTWFVTFEQAKKLKQLGLKSSTYVYDETGELHIIDDNSSIKNSVPAPTIMDATAFLFKKFNLFAYARPVYGKDSKFEFAPCVAHPKCGFENGVSQPTFQEGFSAAIDQALMRIDKFAEFKALLKKHSETIMIDIPGEYVYNELQDAINIFNKGRILEYIDSYEDYLPQEVIDFAQSQFFEK